MNRLDLLMLLGMGSHLFGGTGCTLLSDFDVHQCQDSADCISVPGAIGLCERSQCVTSGCRTNGECVSIDPRFPICQHAGGECVALITEGPECAASSSYDPVTMDNLTGDDLILIGAFTPSVRSAAAASFELATREINALGGLPGARANRPVLVVECDGSMPAEAMYHLVDELSVRAILGSLDASTLRTVVTQRTTREPAFFLSPGSSYIRPSELSSGGEFLWYLGSEYRDVVPAYAALVSGIGSGVEALRSGAPPVKLASITSHRDEDVSLQRAVYDVVAGSERGGPAGQNPFLSFSVEDDTGDSRQAVINLLVSAAPDLVLSFDGGVFGDPATRERASLFRALEEAASGVAYSPRYVFGPSNVEDAALARLALENASFRSRALALRSGRAADPALRAALDARFETAYPQAASSGLHASPGVYDAIYYLAYAVAAAPPDGGDTRAATTLEGLARVTDSSALPVTAGPDGLPRAAEYLSQGTPFNLYGTDGPAEFDLAQHARGGGGHLYCWDERGKPLEFAAFDPAGGFVQTASCESDVAGILAETYAEPR